MREDEIDHYIAELNMIERMENIRMSNENVYVVHDPNEEPKVSNSPTCWGTLQDEEWKNTLLNLMNNRHRLSNEDEETIKTIANKL